MAALSIVRRDLLRFVRNPARTALMFAMPLVLAGIFAIVFGGGDVKVKIRVLVFNEDEGVLSQFLEGASGSEQMEENLELVKVGPEGYEMMENGEASALIHIPKGFSEDYLAGRETTIEVVKNPAQRFLPQVVEEGTGIGAAVLSEASLVFRDELSLVYQLMQEEAFPEDLAVSSVATGVNQKLKGLDTYLFPPVVALETSTRGVEDGAEPEEAASGVDILSYFLPGLSVMGVLFLAQAATRDILRDRETGLLRHLLTTPVSVGDYLAGKSLSVLLVSGLGFFAMVAVGLALGARWGDPTGTALLVMATSVAASGTLLLIMSFVRTERQGDALTTIVIITWSLVGGAFIPLPQIPDFLLPVARTSLVYWATNGFMTLVADGGGVLDVIGNAAVLLGVGGVFLMLGVWFLRRRMAAGEL